MKNKPIITIIFLLTLFILSAFPKNVSLLVGLNNYLYLPDLKYAEKDAEDLETVLKIAGFDTFLLTGQTISGEAILEQINFIAKYSSYSDTFLFFFSGHGAGGSTETEKGMLTAYSDPEKRNAMVSHADLKDSISKFKGKKIVVVDACNQGYETKSQWVRTQGLKNAVDFLLFSSASNQESHDGFKEGNIQIDNGIAAYYLKKAIEGYADFNTDNSLSAGELEEYLTKNAQFYATKFGQYMEVYNNRSNSEKLINLGKPTQQGIQKGTLIVESTPSGAEIWIGGNQYGQTPKSFTADPGTYEVELKKSGYETYRENVTVTTGSTTRVDRRMEEEQMLISSYTTREDVPEMVLVKGGSFQMGNTRNDSEASNKEVPVHTVHLTYDYYIGKYEVTFDEYDLYCESIGKTKPMDDGFGRGMHPVIFVNWWDAIGYCNWLSEKEGLTKAYDSKGNLLDKNGRQTTDITQVEGYRLPTEAEWEYAARGGHEGSTDYKYSGSNRIDNVAWVKSNSNKESHIIGQKNPNELGLYDMSGNVWEWCYDWYIDYKPEPQVNPIGPVSGLYRVLRSGTWYHDTLYSRIAYRTNTSPNNSRNRHGIRIARTKK